MWWSSEPFGTIQLAREGILTPAPDALANGWPSHLRGKGNLWLGFASRYRVIAYAPSRVQSPPRTLRDLVGEFRIGMARPQFGTTRGHMAAVLAEWGEAEFRSWLGDLRAANVRLYDGNASVVRAVARGEIDLGLTDSDDVFASERNGWNVALVTEPVEPPDQTRRSFGAMLIPNTVALVKNGPNPTRGAALLTGILSDEVALALAASDSRNIPPSNDLAQRAGVALPEEPATLDLERIADFLEPAVTLCQEALGA